MPLAGGSSGLPVPSYDRSTVVEVRDSLERLAAPADEQLSWLVANRYSVGELWYELSDLLLLTRIPGIEEGRYMKPGYVEAADDLTAFADSLPLSDFWTDRALAEDGRWTTMRAKARNVLARLNVTDLDRDVA